MKHYIVQLNETQRQALLDQAHLCLADPEQDETAERLWVEIILLLENAAEIDAPVVG